MIYEYDGFYFIIQRSKQDKDAESSPSENVALAAKLRVNEVSDELLGEKSLQALHEFGKVEPVYKPWKLKELRKQLTSWTGARAFTSLHKNSRTVVVQQDFEKNHIEILPYDNCNIKSYESIMSEHVIILSMSVSNSDMGSAIKKAFSVTTYHPEYKK